MAAALGARARGKEGVRARIGAKARAKSFASICICTSVSICSKGRSQQESVSATARARLPRAQTRAAHVVLSCAQARICGSEEELGAVQCLVLRLLFRQAFGPGVHSRNVKLQNPFII